MIIIDIECVYSIEKKLLVKELAIVSEKHVGCFHVCVPFNSQLPPTTSEAYKTNEWLKCQRHGLDWKSGNLSMQQVVKLLQPLLTEQVYAKGNQKCKLLEKLLHISVVDLELYQCPRIVDLKTEAQRCVVH